VQVGKEVSLATLDLTNKEILVRGIANVSPHWKIFHKHFKEVIVVNSFLELFQLLLVKRRLTQKTPVDGIHKGYFSGRRLEMITKERFAETQLVLEAAETFFAREVRVQVHILFYSSLLLFLFRRMLVAKRE
jgi:hypothetical protein